MKLNFFDVNKEYIRFLQNAEFDNRGFTCVPNMEYGHREQKFLCGIVLDINGFNYYVPVTSYKKKQSESILIKFEDDRENPIKGSLRFNYMIPVPDTCITKRIIKEEDNKSRRVFLGKQLEYIRSISEKIYKKARRTYNNVKGEYYPHIKQYACDFELLEQKCIEYENILANESMYIEDDLEL